MSTVNLDSLDPRAFGAIVPTRMAQIEAASDAPLPGSDAISDLAAALHPGAQHLLIEAVTEYVDARSFRLVPDPAKGGSALAYFSAGQYVSITLDIDGALVSKPYSLSSAPADALKGSYEITVKRSENGFVSEHILDTWKVGDRVVVSGPAGAFTYEALRDAPQVVGLAGGSGITPFLSLARALADGTEEFNLTLLYGSRTRDGILFKDELDALEAACPAFKVVHVLSDEAAEGYEHGFITAELIKKYAPGEDYSLFVCGPQAMYTFVDAEIAKLKLPAGRVRHELFGEYKNPEKDAGYPQEAAGKTFTLTVSLRDQKHEIPCLASETLLIAMDRAKIPAPSLCRSGECGYCHSRLAGGEVYIPDSVDGRRLADLTFGYVHPCCTFPLSDVALEIPTK